MIKTFRFQTQKPESKMISAPKNCQMADYLDDKQNYGSDKACDPINP